MISESISNHRLANQPLVDDGWAWLYVFATFANRIIYDGFVFSIGVFYEPLYIYFNASNAATSLVASILFGIIFLSGPFASCLVNRFGCRKVGVSGSLIAAAGALLSLAMPRIEYLYITMGLLCGFGIGILDLTTVAVIGVHFQKKRATAMGISFSGSGCGSLVMAPLIGFLNEFYGFWKGTMLIAAGLLLNCMVLSLLYSDFGSATDKSEESTADAHQSSTQSVNESDNPSSTTDKVSGANQTTDNSSERKTQLSSDNHVSVWEAASMEFNERSRSRKFADAIHELIDLSVFSNYVYIVFTVGHFILDLGIRIPFVYIPHRVTELGLANAQEASFLIAIIGISNTLGRLLFGVLADKTSIKRINLFNAILFVNGLSHFTTSFITKYYQMALYCSVFGVTFGGLACLTPVVLADLLGISKLNTSYGLLGLTCGVSISIGTPLTGMIKDRTNSYEQGFYATGGIVIASALVLCLIPIVQKRCPQ